MAALPIGVRWGAPPCAARPAIPRIGRRGEPTGERITAAAITADTMVVAITADTTAVITAVAVMVIQPAQLRRAWPLARRLAWRSERRQPRPIGRRLIMCRLPLQLPAAIIPTLHVRNRRRHLRRWRQRCWSTRARAHGR